MRWNWRIFLMAGLLLLPGFARQAMAQEKPVLVFAAASLKNALDDVVTQYQNGTGKTVSVSYAASSALAQQIESSAPADIFISADLDWMDELAGKNLINASTRKALLGNKLVLIAPVKTAHPVAIKPGFPLAKLLKGGRLALADPDSVPAGKYGKAALQYLGVWDSVANSLAPGENVRATLELVARGEAPYGIVYKTDAAVEPAVKIVGFFPEDSHKPVVYPVALIASSSNPDAAAFLAYMESAKAKPLFRKQGFTVLP
jgi:molybdate transport system substrate-binding protein